MRALYNEREIAFRFTWNDPNETKTAPADGLALVFLRDRRQKFQVGSLRGCPLWADAPGLDIRRWSPLEEAAEDSKASYSQGQWNLLLKRPLESRQPVLMGVAVWDGANGEEGRKRSNSNWVDLLFAPGTLKGDSK
ncbi:MAG: hypothetical protein HYZ90_02875 [Candidatus Omnitrophica bacterium]|nr:hypothetical protein [Candidatus Omnitrophota bacterium]